MAEDVGEETVTSALELLLKVGNLLLRNAKEEAAASLEKFVPHKIATLFGIITAGADFFHSIGVKTKDAADALLRSFSHHAAVKAKVEELHQLEADWDGFLHGVDLGLQTSDGRLSGSCVERLSPDAELTDARSGRSVRLGQFLVPGQKLLLVLLRHVA